MSMDEEQQLERGARAATKAGDTFYQFVFYANSNEVKLVRSLEVTRTTATQIHLSGGIKLRRDTGTIVGFKPTLWSIPTEYRPALPHVVQRAQQEMARLDREQRVSRVQGMLRSALRGPMSDALLLKLEEAATIAENEGVADEIDT